MKRHLRILAAALALAMLWAPATASAAKDSATATTMRLELTEGTVTLKNLNGKTLTVKDGMKLASGNALTTAKSSYAYISLDENKAVKLDASSAARVQKSGKKLQVQLSSGKLFFDVKVPLADDESLDVRTSTMVTGIRGTAGVIDVVDENTSVLYLLDGKVEMTSVDPATGESGSVFVTAGQRAVSARTADGEGLTVSVGTFDEAGVPGFAAVEIAKDETLQQKIAEQSGLDTSVIAENAGQSLARDEAKAASQPEASAPAQGGASVDSAFPGDTAGGGGGSGGGGGGSSTPDPDPEPPAVDPTPDPDPEPPAVDPTPDPDPEPPVVDPTPDPDPEPPVVDPTPDPDPEPPTPSTTTLSGVLTAAALNTALGDFETVKLDATADAALEAGETVSVPADKTLALDGGARLTVNTSASFGVSGTLSIGAGAQVENSGTISSVGTITNTGMLNNLGAFDPGLGSTGAFTTTGVFTDTAHEAYAYGASGAVSSLGGFADMTWKNSVTVALLGDAAIAENLSLSAQNAALELGGHTLDLGQKTLTVTGALTVRDATGSGKILANAAPSAIFVNSVELKLEGGTVSGTGSGNLIELTGTGAKLTLDGGVIHKENASGYLVSGQAGTRVNVVSGSLAGGQAGIYTQGSITMSGGTISSQTGIFSTGVTQLTGGTVSGTEYGVNNGGELSLQDVTVELTEESGQYAISGAFTYGSGTVRARGSMNRICQSFPSGFTAASDASNEWYTLVRIST